MITIGAIIPLREHATSFYRADGPLSALPRDKYQVIEKTSLSWSQLRYVDIMFVQRPFAREHLGGCEMIKQNNIPLWLDYDDDVFTVQLDNPSYWAFANDDVTGNAKKMLAMADVVTVSTPDLKRAFDQYNKNVIVIPNSHDDRWWPWEKQGERNKRVLWRGSKTHTKDWNLFNDKVEALAQSEMAKDWEWAFIGNGAWHLAEKITKRNMIPNLDIPSYFKSLRDLAPLINIFPLHDSLFNRSKSNCCWLEATYGGAVTFSTGLPEYTKPGILHMDDLATYIENPSRLNEHYEVSYEYIKNNLLLSQTNKLREELILGLT